MNLNGNEEREERQIQKRFGKKLIWMLVCAVVFFLVSMPFRRFFALMPMTEVRPASVLPPFFGLVFGFWGAIGAAAGNLAADLVSGYSIPLCLTGFVAQFLYGYVPYWLWHSFPLKGEGRAKLPRMDTTAHVVKYLLIVLADSAMVALLLGFLLQVFGVSPILSASTLILFLNNLDFCILLGMPLFILVSFRKGERFSLNERVILVFLLLGLLVAVLTGICAYQSGETGQAAVLTWNRVYLYVAVSLNLFFLVAILFLWYMERNVTVPVEKLSDAAAGYVGETGEEPDHGSFIRLCKPYCQRNSEVGNLARSFVKLMENLDRYLDHLKKVTAEKERIGAELAVATQIQASMLPSIFPAFPQRSEFDIYATMTPAKEVGGDFYDFFLVDENHLAVVIADVSGKGVPAALFMVIAKTLIQNHAQTGEHPAEVFTKVNRQLCENNEAGLFVTAWMGILNLTTGEFIYVNAGHNPPLLLQEKGDFHYLKSRPGFVLAGMEETRYREGSLTLKAGDLLYLYTDGVTEATDTRDQLYGEERLLKKLNESKDLPLSEILHGVKEDVDLFAKEAEQFDDITMLALRVNE